MEEAELEKRKEYWKHEIEEKELELKESISDFISGISTIGKVSIIAGGLLIVLFQLFRIFSDDDEYKPSKKSTFLGRLSPIKIKLKQLAILALLYYAKVQLKKFLESLEENSHDLIEKAKTTNGSD